MAEATYEDNVKIWKDAYTEIKQVCEKYAVDFDNKYGSYDIGSMLRDAEAHLRQYEYYEKYGIRINDPVTSIEFVRIDDYRTINLMNGDTRKISWPDDGKQPKNERLYNIAFSTGAYIFGSSGFGDNEDYPKEFFMKFLDKLKSYKPDYIDSANKSLYWKMDNAKDIHNDFPEILREHQILNAEDRKRREIKKLEAQLEKMKQPPAPHKEG